MPLIIICGTPVSGKTTRAYEIKAYFEKKHGKKVEIISEDEAIVKLGYDKNSNYLDSQKEKRVRGYLKSETIKLIGKDNVVILDGSNYIKGYRYELYCASKASKSTQCTIYTIRYKEDAWKDNQKRLGEKAREDTTNCVCEKDSNKGDHKSNDVNDISEEIVSITSSCTLEDNNGIDACNYVPYMDEVFTALTEFRFEEPISSNRWDSPLFTVQPTDELNLDDVYKVLFEKKPPPPNMSTQNPPLSSTNFLYELDRVTQAISKQILESKQLHVDSELKFPEYPNCILDSGFVQFVNPQKLLRLRRQFLTYAKMQHSNEDASKIGRYFIQYLNKTLTE